MLISVRYSDSRIGKCFLTQHNSILMEEMVTMGIKDFVSTSIPSSLLAAPEIVLESPPRGAYNTLSKDDWWRRCAGSEMSGRARPGATQTGF